MVGLPIRQFMKEVYLNVFMVTIVSSILPLLLNRILIVNSFNSFALTVLITVLYTALVIFFIGCSKHDKSIIKSGILKILAKIKNEKS